DLLDQALLSVGIPESQQFQYTWHPKLQSAPGTAETALFWNQIVEPGRTLDGDFQITAIATIPLRPGTDPSVQTTAVLTNVTFNLLPGLAVISLPFYSIRFAAKTGEKANVDVSLGNVQFRGPLLFVQELQKKLNPSSGPFLQLMPNRLLAGFRFALPSLTL